MLNAHCLLPVRYRVSRFTWLILALGAGYHPVSWLHLHPAGNVLQSASRDRDHEELRNV